MTMWHPDLNFRPHHPRRATFVFDFPSLHSPWNLIEIRGPPHHSPWKIWRKLLFQSYGKSCYSFKPSIVGLHGPSLNWHNTMTLLPPITLQGNEEHWTRSRNYSKFIYERLPSPSINISSLIVTNIDERQNTRTAPTIFYRAPRTSIITRSRGRL